MKKILFAAFAGVCVLSSIMATTVKPIARVYTSNEISQMLSDTTPMKSKKHKKSDTGSYPGRDTTMMPKAQ